MKDKEGSIDIVYINSNVKIKTLGLNSNNEVTEGLTDLIIRKRISNNFDKKDYMKLCESMWDEITHIEAYQKGIEDTLIRVEDVKKAKDSNAD